MGLLAYGLIALAIIAGLGGLYGTIHHSGVQEGRAEIQKMWDDANAKARARELKQGEQAATGLEADREKAKVIYRTITQQVDRIVERPVYRNVCLDADGLRLARCAIRGESADSCKPDGAVPAPAKPSGRDGRVGLALDYRLGSGVSGLRGETSSAD